MLNDTAANDLSILPHGMFLLYDIVTVFDTAGGSFDVTLNVSWNRVGAITRRSTRSHFHSFDSHLSRQCNKEHPFGRSSWLRGRWDYELSHLRWIQCKLGKLGAILPIGGNTDTRN